jgi:hypothetical protein
MIDTVFQILFEDSLLGFKNAFRGMFRIPALLLRASYYNPM